MRQGRSVADGRNCVDESSSVFSRRFLVQNDTESSVGDAKSESAMQGEVITIDAKTRERRRSISTAIHGAARLAC